MQEGMLVTDPSIIIPNPSSNPIPDPDPDH